MIEDQSNDVVVMFKEESGLPFELRLDSGIVPTLIAALMALANRSGAESPMATASQPVTITSAQMLLGPNGQPGLELMIEGTVPIPLRFAGDAIPMLRHALTQLEERATPRSEAPARP
jgi:hypothetical protein